MSFQGKTAVITGASSGIGLLCAQCFAEQGANIVMLATNPTKLQSKVDALTAKGYHAIGIPTDVRNYAQVADAFQKAKEAFSTIDIVINSAGGSEIRICGVERGTPFQDVPIEVFDWGLDVNLKGPFYMGHAAMKYMAEQKSGVIINIGSITGAEASCGDVAYATAKSGVMNGLTKSLALVGAPYGVRCCCVSVCSKRAVWQRPCSAPIDGADERCHGEYEDAAGTRRRTSGDCGSDHVPCL